MGRSRGGAAGWDARALGYAAKDHGPYVSRVLPLALDCGCGSAIDIGCGPGTLAVPLAQVGVRVMAVDFSPAMLRLTVERAAEAGVADLVETRLMDWTGCGWEDAGRYDLAIASRSLCGVDPCRAREVLEMCGARRLAVEPGGEIPSRDRRLLAAARVERPVDAGSESGIQAAVEASGRPFSVTVIENPQRLVAGSMAGLEETAYRLAGGKALPPDAAARVRKFARRHAILVDGGFGLDYELKGTWVATSW